MATKTPTGFSRNAVVREKPCIGIFADAFGGKSHLIATVDEWSKQQDKTPAALILDRKSKQVIHDVCAEMGMEPPLMNDDDYISGRQALQLARREIKAGTEDESETKKVYGAVIDKIENDLLSFAENTDIDPIMVDGGTELWDWIGYALLGKREGVKARYWGPSKRKWQDLFDALKYKTVLITFKARDEWKADARTGRSTIDGPPHLEYTLTSTVRLTHNEREKDAEKKYGLDVVQSIDNKGLEGVENALQGEAITFANLMSLLRPEGD